ncbi:CoA transferase [Glaciimonas sp. CA11.2]|uniref:CaiB/BaiF CoA transferase family protein n=1 Tax=Glaciimonas sp. CA11.2 TaxID=3048601 RepID=UPI002AB42568|nr:CoA transferase [Glaciimonas sp. CA11.2]MDY7548323.1 CoA transferase [Glaciimonas sp. CA11.2]MEB0162350.1 CoA transferase [Glaciimonas sp. CA11.2]
MAEAKQMGDAAPLAGVRILDLTTIMLGPFASQQLGDYGADVIKIEAPGGDATRQIGPSPEVDMAAAFLGVNRGKRSIILDLKQSTARDALFALIDNADVLLHSMRPQKMAALGFSPEALLERNPRLIVVAAHGFGEDGPYAGRPAYDDIIQGLCGLAGLSADQGGEPSYVPSVIADKICGMFATQAVLMGLVRRAREGSGVYVEVPMLESMVHFTLIEHFYGAHFVPPEGEAGYPRLLTRWRRPYRTTDGYVCIVPYTDRHWRLFFSEAGVPEYADDPRFMGIGARTRHIDELYRLVGERVAMCSSAVWLAACDRLDIPAAPLNRLADLERDPHLMAVGMFPTVDDAALGKVKLVAPPMRFNGKRPPVAMPPRLGEHTNEILAQAGIGTSAREAMLASGGAIQFYPNTADGEGVVKTNSPATGYTISGVTS